MVASRSINVKWQHKSQDTSEVTKYILQYKEGEGRSEKMLSRRCAKHGEFAEHKAMLVSSLEIYYNMSPWKFAE